MTIQSIITNLVQTIERYDHWLSDPELIQSVILVKIGVLKGKD